MRTFLAHQLAQQHPQHDPHPLAREDGGWYPGKHFDPTDILTDPKNWTVWKQFLMFFFGILCVPVLSFVGIEWLLRVVFHLKFQQSQTIGAIVAIVVLQIFMISYARRAVVEETTDYAEQQRTLRQKKDVPEATESLLDSAQDQVHKTDDGEMKESVHEGTGGEEAQHVTAKSTVEEHAGIDKEAMGSLIAEDGSVAKDAHSSVGEDASVGSAQVLDETMPEKQEDELGFGGQVKKRR